ncbi:MAG: DUF433 domain-containing protein [Gaiellaceae bacterium]
MARGSKAKQQVAFRVQPGTLAHLKRRVSETGLSQTELAERYLEEGLRLDEYPLIAFRDGAAGRRPGLIGSRLDVWQLVETVRQNGSVEEAAAYLELPVEKVQAAMRYYADYTDEIDDWISRANALAEREQASWRRQQDLVG